MSTTPRAPRVRAAHVLATRRGKTVLEIFDAADIASRFAASRCRALRNLGWAVDRHDFIVGGPDDPAVLRPAVDEVVRHLGRQNPQGARYEFVEQALAAHLVGREPNDRAGRLYLVADRNDPVRLAFRTVQRASPAALRFIDATPPAGHS